MSTANPLDGVVRSKVIVVTTTPLPALTGSICTALPAVPDWKPLAVVSVSVGSSPATSSAIENVPPVKAVEAGVGLVKSEVDVIVPPAPMTVA